MATQPNPGIADELARRLDELALELTLPTNAADPDRWAASLTALARYAESSGCGDLAAAADSAADALRNAPEWVAAEEARLELAQAIEKLRAELPSSSCEPESNAFNLADDPELIRDFVAECREHLLAIEQHALVLDGDAGNLEAIHSLFRSFHTIKGLAGFLGFEAIQGLSHEVETLLDLARNSKLSLSRHAIDIVLECKDYISRWITVLEAPAESRLAYPAPDERLIARVQAIATNPGSVAAQAPAVEATQSNAEATPDSGRQLVAARFVKVDTEKLDYLVDMVGEMVIAQSMVRHDPDLKVEGNGRLERNLAQLARMTDEVQRTAMAMRMVPVSGLFQKMVRLVRDLSRKFGKQIRVETEGDDVELDRNIVEELADPMMHMIRNAADHGIETPAERAASGKDPTAVVFLRAHHSAGYIEIEVSDDGRGVNRQKVLARARERGLVAPNAQLSDAECDNLIFQPGFSTAEKVSEVSGRGVGMDVVRKQIQKLRGSVELTSVTGKGATFSLRVPLTLAIIDGLVVETGSERYILPLTSVKELFRPTAGQVSTVEGKAEVASVRDRLLPVMRLYERFGIQPRTTDPTTAVFVTAESDGNTFCIMVDELIGKQEVVIKTLGNAFRNVSGVAGGAILGDGRVGLILDLPTLFAGRHQCRAR
ncbi:MAG TPA: chemotaxis protein CheA [Bryobacteraceae bacterium]|nr:chemotaxis protein CheA [Bryobacteraceae bacterium]